MPDSVPMRLTHDDLFKYTFARPMHARCLLRRVLPRRLVEAADWSTLRLLPASFTADVLGPRHADLLFELSIRDRRTPIHILIEHKSEPDRLTPIQIHVYTGRIWQRLLREAPRTRVLPAVVPVVMYHGSKPWPSGPRLSKLLLEGPDDPLAMLVPRIAPDPEVSLLDISELPEDKLRATFSTPLGFLTALSLQRCHRRRNLLEEVSVWECFARDLAKEPGGVEDLFMLLRYNRGIHDVGSEPEREQLFALFAAWGGPEMENFMKTYDGRLIEEGKKEGRKELLLEQLGERFGRLSEDVIARVRQAERKQLRLWAKRVLDAKTLEEVFA